MHRRASKSIQNACDLDMRGGYEGAKMKFLEARFVALALVLSSALLGMVFQQSLSDFAHDLGVDGSSMSPPVRSVISDVVLVTLGIGLAVGILRNPAVEAWLTARRLNKLHDLEAAYGKPSAGWLPKISSNWVWDDVWLDPKSPMYEAMSGIIDRVLHDFGKPPRQILVTSGVPGEGKTTVAYGLATLLARRGRNVLVIDADMRRPSLHGIFGVQNNCGLSNLGVGEETGEPVLLSVAPQLSLLCAGPNPLNAGEVLSSGTISEMMKGFQERFDIVVIDSPPVLGLADVPALARQVEFIIYIVRYGRTGANLAVDTFKRITSITRAQIVLVGTALPTRKLLGGFGYSYDYGYGYSYPSTNEKEIEVFPKKYKPPIRNRWYFNDIIAIIFTWSAWPIVALLFAWAIYNCFPHALDQVGKGIVSARVDRDTIRIEGQYGRYRGVDRALRSAGEAVIATSQAIQNNLPPLRTDTKWIILRFIFKKQDRLGNFAPAPLISLVFSRNDLEKVNLYYFDSYRILSLAKHGQVWDTGWPTEIAQYCLKPAAHQGAVELCKTLNGKVPQPPAGSKR